MLLTQTSTQYTTAVVHEGKVVVFAVTAASKIFYTVKQDGFENTVPNQSAELSGWEEWQSLLLPEEDIDSSVAAQEKLEQTYVDEQGSTRYLLRSRYRTTNDTALAPIQVISELGHLYVFRQSLQNTLLVDRFVLDGMQNRLVRKLEVRYKRSRQKYVPQAPTKTDGKTSSDSLDSLDFRDSNNNPFFEPTTELSFLNTLANGWFTVVLLPTNEHDRYRWHIFAYNSQTQKIDLVSIRTSQNGLFDTTDELVLMPKPGQLDTLEPQQLAGIIQRSLVLQTQSGEELPVTNGFAATKYDVQIERQTRAGLQLLREATRVMLAVPTTSGTVNLSFAIALDGTLAQIDTTPQSKLLRSLNQAVLLPLDTLERIKAVAKSKSVCQGKITKMERSQTDDRIKIVFHSSQAPTDDDIVKIFDTVSYNGRYSITKIDAETFEIQAQWKGQEVGNWQVLPKEDSGLIFNGSITAFERTADGKLRITAPGHGLETNDEVQLANFPAYNNTYPIVEAGTEYFIVDGKWQLAEAVNLKLESRKRRGIQFDGRNDRLQIEAIALPQPSETRSLNRTYSAWIYYNPIEETSLPRLIAGQSDRSMELLVQQGKVILQSQTEQGTIEIGDPQALPLQTWVHYAATVTCDPNPQQSTLKLYCNGVEVATQSVGQALVARSIGSLEFNGTQDCIRLGTFQQITGQITLAAWIRPTANDNIRNIIAKGWRTNPNQEIFFRILNGQYQIGSWDGNNYFTTAPMPTEDLGQWIYLVGVYDGTYWRLYRNGVEISSTPASVGAIKVDADWAIGANGNGNDRFYKGQIDEVSIWNRALSATEISGQYGKRLAGTEPGLVGYWRFEDGLSWDLSSANNHGRVQGAPTSGAGCPLPSLPASLWVAGKARTKQVSGFAGRIAELQVWDSVRSAEDISNTMYLQLIGNEANLVGYWRMGAIVTERDRSTTLDFSLSSNAALVYGNPFVSAATLSRTLGDGITPVVQFSNPELIAVSQRSTYRESFEFKLDTEIDPNAIGGDRAFDFTCWGQANRNSNESVEITVTQSEFTAIGKGWYRAECQYTIPDDVKFVRSFELSNLRGNWNTLEICKHQIEVTSNSVTQAHYTDLVKLSAVGDTQAILKAKLQDLDRQQQQRLTRLAEIRELRLKLDRSANRTELEGQIRLAQDTLNRLIADSKEKEQAYQTQRNNPLNFWCLLLPQQDLSTVARIFIETKQLVYSAGWRKDTNIDVTTFWNALFKFTWIESEKAYMISNYVSKEGQTHILTRDGGSFIGKTENWLGDPSRKNTQLWGIKAFESGLYEIRSKVDNDPISLYYDGWKRETNIIPWDVPADQVGQLWKFEIVPKWDVASPAAIDAAYQAWQQKLTEVNQARRTVTDLQAVLNASETDKQQWQTRLNQARQELNQIEQRIATLNTEILNGIRQTQQRAIALPQLTKDPRDLVVKGAVLEFVRPATRLSLLETCEGNVQLSYVDEEGQLRLTQFDATADSRNSKCEEWIFDGIRTYLQIPTAGALQLDRPISLPPQWTAEAWFALPLPELPWNTLISTDQDFQIVVKDGKQLGFVSAGQFYSCGYDLTQLPLGWHHLAIAGGIQGNSDAATFYINGAKAGEANASLLVRSLQFDGIDDYIELPEETNATRIDYPRGITVEAWVYYDSFKSWSRIIDFGNGAGKDNIVLTHVGTSRRARFFANSVGMSTKNEVLQPNQWTHIAATLDANKRPAIYVNGVPQELVFEDLGGGSARQNQLMLPNAVVRKQNYIGRSNWNNDGYFNGRIAEVRVWNVARTIDEIQQTMYRRLNGNELGLAGYWYFDENQFKDHAPALRHGQMRGSPTPSSISTSLSRSVTTIGNAPSRDRSFGAIAEVRLWQVALSAEEIEINSKVVLSGYEPDLVAYYPFDRLEDKILNRAIADTSSKSYGLSLQGSCTLQPWINPIGRFNPTQVKPTDSVNSVEYSTTNLVGGAKVLMMRRFLMYRVPNGVNLLSGKRIETLEMQWIGNAQFEPTLLGYIEGSPPVPSENLTVNSDYNGATSVELAMAGNVEYRWNREEANRIAGSGSLFLGFDNVITASKEVELGIAFGVAAGVKLGIGVNALQVRSGVKASLASQNSFLRQSTVSTTSGLSISDQLSLRGTPETEPKFEHLGKRFIPKNVGYALVVSGLADVFITRLKRSQKMVSYQIQPNNDIPLDVNTITFLINPTYTMNGSLDGLTGSSPTSDRYFRQVPQMRSQYGSNFAASYYRLAEAYRLKTKIDQQDKEREAYFHNTRFDLRYDPASLSWMIPNATSESDAPALNQQTATKKQEIDKKMADMQQQVHANTAYESWQLRMENLQVLAGKRNIVNTYVWDADGGLRTEAQQFANTVVQMVGGSYSLDLAAGGEAKLLVMGGGAELSYQFGFSMTHTMTKTETTSKGFALNVDLSGVESIGVTDYNDIPILPGEKVSRYRFMSFYLEADTEHFRHFFDEVVDREWLNGNSEEARTLRQINTNKPNKTWRVLHRVTYVERPTLAGFGQDVRKLVSGKQVLPAQALVSRLEQLEKHNQELETKIEQILQLLQSEFSKKTSG